MKFLKEIQEKEEEEEEYHPPEMVESDDEESPEPLETDERGLPNLLNKKKGAIMETQDGDKWIIHLENVDSEIDSSSIIDVKSKMCCM